MKLTPDYCAGYEYADNAKTIAQVEKHFRGEIALDCSDDWFNGFNDGRDDIANGQFMGIGYCKAKGMI